MGAVVCPLALLIPTGIPFSESVAFVVSSTILTVVSPIQDHLRRVLHLANTSWSAATASGVQLIVVLVSIVVMDTAGINRAWIPFTVLAVANLVSLLFGLHFVRRARRPLSVPDLRLRNLLRSGSWLLTGTLYVYLAQFIAIALVTTIANAAAAGYVEAARILAQPVTVLAIGILSVFRPELITYSQQLNGTMVRRLNRFYMAIVAIAALAWGAIVCVHSPGNPLPRLFSKAYAVHGVLPFSIFLQAAGYAALGYGIALVASNRQRAFFWQDLLNGTAVIAVTAALAPSGAYALLWSGLVGVILIYAANIYMFRLIFGKKSAVSEVTGGN